MTSVHHTLFDSFPTKRGACDYFNRRFHSSKIASEIGGRQRFSILVTVIMKIRIFRSWSKIINLHNLFYITSLKMIRNKKYDDEKFLINELMCISLTFHMPFHI